MFLRFDTDRMKNYYNRLYQTAAEIVNNPVVDMDEAQAQLEDIAKKIACFPDPEKFKYSQLLSSGWEAANRGNDEVLKEMYMDLIVFFPVAYAEPDMREVKEAYGDDAAGRDERKNNM